MTQFRKNQPQNRNFSQRERETNFHPNQNQRNNNRYRDDEDDYQSFTNRYNERNTDPYETRYQEEQNYTSPYNTTPYNTYQPEREEREPRYDERYSTQRNQRNQNQNLGYGQYNYNNLEDRQNPYNGFENERYTSAEYNRYNENRNTRNYNEPQNNRYQEDYRRNSRTYNEDPNQHNYRGYERDYNEYNEGRNPWNSNDFERYNSERTNRNQGEQFASHRGKGPKGYMRSNERITEDINDRLSDDYRIDASNIDVKVENNEVILTGTVNSKEDKRRCEDICEAVSGVSNVENRLRVTQENNPSNKNYPSKGLQSYREENTTTNTNKEDKNKAKTN